MKDALVLMDRNVHVVSNDASKVEPTGKSVVLKATVKSLLEMESKRKQWETTAYRTSNQQLYGVLAECLAYGGELEKSKAKERSAALEEFISKRGYYIKKDSPLMTRIVKAVFGDVDRRRISTYSLVLRTAQKNGISPEQLTDWIEQKGGVQEVKLAQSKTFISPADKAKSAKKEFAALANLAVVKTAQLSLLADADFVGEECVLLAEQQSDGSFAIKALIRSNGAVNAALTSLYSQTKAAKAG